MHDVQASGLLNSRTVQEMNLRTQPPTRKDPVGNTDDRQRLQNAAKEFEAIFLSYMLSVMRQTIEESGVTEKGMGAGIYTELFDQEVARSLADRGALGITDLLVKRLENQVSGQEPEKAQPERQKMGAATGHGFPAGDPEEVPDFRMPVQAHISSDFGMRKDPFTHRMRMHEGIDIAAPEGMEVQAACAGSVVSSGYEKGYGNTVVVRHPGGYETRYAHLGALLVRAGDQVPEHGVLGTVGSTGRSTGPHLHFEVMRHGDRINPVQLIP